MKEKLPLIFSSIALVLSIVAIVITLMFGGVFRSVGSSGTQKQAPSGMSTDGGGQQGGLRQQTVLTAQAVRAALPEHDSALPYRHKGDQLYEVKRF